MWSSASRASRTRSGPRTAVLVLILALGAACGGEAGLPARPDLVIVTIDTLRADHLGTYGYFRDTSPRIDRFAREALVFERAYAPMATTLPSHVSLLTGTHPLRHGVVSNFRFFGQAVPADERLATAAEVLGARGWRTAAFTSASPLSAATGIDRGFDTFHGPPPWSEATRRSEWRAAQTVDAARAWLASEAVAPFFLWVHLFDPHDPYAAPPPFDAAFGPEPELARRLRERGLPPRDVRRVAPLVDAYDGEIAYTDHQVGRLLDALRSRGSWDRTVVVIAGDHGEGLWQHGHPRHGLTWNEQIRVPLLVRIPGGPRGRSDALVSLVDVLPILAGQAGLPFDTTRLDGADAVRAPRDAVLSQGVVRRHRPRPAFTFQSGPWKFWLREGAPDRLYHLGRDPHELEDVIERHPEVAAAARRALRERMAELEARAVVPLERSLPEAVREQLRALGYVE